MKTIYKYALDHTIRLPIDSVIIDFAEQQGTYYIWAIVDTDKMLQERHFCILGTGWEIPQDAELKYIKTTHYNKLVWHLFEEIRIPPTLGLSLNDHTSAPRDIERLNELSVSYP